MILPCPEPLRCRFHGHAAGVFGQAANPVGRSLQGRVARAVSQHINNHSRSDTVDDVLVANTVGLVTLDQYKQKKAVIESLQEKERRKEEKRKCACILLCELNSHSRCLQE
jgi:hypothetical protein